MMPITSTSAYSSVLASALAGERLPARSKVLPKSFEDRMPHFPLGGLGPVLDLGEELRLDPDALVGDALAVGLGLSHEWLQPLVKLNRRRLVESAVDLAGIDQFVTLASCEVYSVPFAIVECEPGNCQG